MKLITNNQKQITTMNRTSKVLNIVFLVSIFILLIVEIWYNSKLEEQIIERDNLIRELTISEEQFNYYD